MARAKSLGKKARGVRQKFLANRYHMQAVDQSLLTSSGLGYAHYQAPARSPAALAPQERRFYVDIGDLPDAMHATANGRTRRACVENAATGERWLENPLSGNRDQLWCHLDQGAIGWPAQHWLYGDMRLRGFFFGDISHRRHDNYQDVFKESGIGWVFSEMVLCTSIGNAPWRGCGHYGKMSEAADELFRNYGPDSMPAFETLYPHIVTRKTADRCSLPPLYGTQAHVEATWRAASEAPVFHSKGLTAKKGRWFQARRCWGAISDYIHEYVLVIFYIGMHLGWWKTLETSPLGEASRSWRSFDNGGGEQRPLPVAAGDGDGDEENHDVHGLGVRPEREHGPAPAGHGDPDRGVGASNYKVDKLAGNKNALLVVADILSKRSSVALIDGTVALSEFVDLEHGRAIVLGKTPAGCREYFESMAIDRVGFVWTPTVKLLQDITFYRRLGILLKPGGGVAEMA